MASLLRSVNVQVRLDLLAPAPRPLPAAPLLALPGPGHPGTLSTAFTYLLRFELERRHPTARTHAWVAEQAPAVLERLAPEFAGRAEAAGEEAGRALSAYAKEPMPSASDRSRMAGHALRLARLDAVVRSGYVDERLEETADEDVADLLRMLDATPWDQLAAPGAQLDLNPSFGRASILVPGADADAILDGCLVSVRTSKSDRITAEDVRPLLLRFLLARLARADDPAFPDVRELALLHARHGTIWRASVAPILAHPGLPAVEAWMLRHMERERGLTLKSIGKAATLDDAPEAKTLQRTPGWVKKRWGRNKRAPQTAPEGKADKKKRDAS